MEKTPPVPQVPLASADEAYKGPTPWRAALREFSFNTLLIGFPLFGFTIGGKWSRWDTFFVGLGTAVGLITGRIAYKDAEAAQAQHTRLVSENHLMRAQLNQTGQVLNQVADSLTAERDALTAKIEARSKLGTQVKPPAASHAEAMQAEKLAAAEASPTIH